MRIIRWRIFLPLLILGVIYSRAQTACEQITSLSSMQDVIDDAAPSEVVVCLDGSEAGSGWSMEEEDPLTIQPAQKVIIDCQGASFNYHSNKGNLTLGEGSVLEYQNCDLLDFDYPEGLKVFGSSQQFKDCLIGMTVCRFVDEISDQYAQILIAAQPNATLLLGELVSTAEGSAITMFYVAYDSLNDAAQVRFIHTNCTVYCGDKTVAVASAQDLATENGPVLTVSSESFAARDDSTASQEGPESTSEASTKSEVPTWFIIVATLASVALVVLAALGYVHWRKKKNVEEAEAPKETDESNHEEQLMEQKAAMELEEEEHGDRP